MDETGTSYRLLRHHRGDTAPSLEPARQRVELAAERLDELRAAADELLAAAVSEPLRIGFDRKLLDATGQFSAEVLFWSNEVPAPRQVFRVRMLAGEFLFHLRTALEYVAYHLVWLDSGVEFAKSQFPILSEKPDQDMESRWANECARKVPGLSDRHLAMVKALQPFAGCSWTGRLADLNNQDKHRGVLRLRVQDVAGLPPPGGELELMPSPTRPDLYEVIRPGGVEVDLVLEDDTPALPLLGEFLIQVVEVINAFEETFEEAVPVEP